MDIDKYLEDVSAYKLAAKSPQNTTARAEEFYALQRLLQDRHANDHAMADATLALKSAYSETPGQFERFDAGIESALLRHNDSGAGRGANIDSYFRSVSDHRYTKAHPGSIIDREERLYALHSLLKDSGHQNTRALKAAKSALRQAYSDAPSGQFIQFDAGVKKTLRDFEVQAKAG